MKTRLLLGAAVAVAVLVVAVADGGLTPLCVVGVWLLGFIWLGLVFAQRSRDVKGRTG